MGRVLRSSLAGRDLDRIFRDISANNGDSVAVAQLNRIEAALERLGSFPNLGRDRSDLLPGLRALSVKSWEVFYRVRDEDVLVSRVLDGRMNLAAQFGKKT
ncbi:type II toxin-antitoxin system RelE/ParE family toxin [Caulobacter sp. RL271]|uniref:Type II toxin-antitoxin system RelE/ParE family toxin n=1 Tax=Caulobacter segnis TaxID=88688 RepID=A0ABY4ZR04_9CAUL|nr:type II toxin-antitoxin system RelE/ParE family toxin [Caulobacter segnis]USQ94824.1 type II toxin-antitoxin system RelE/ParE family toxin [Caulobacter segnis]